MILVGCDPAIDPFQENDRYYSVFGVIDASADTQFVRVEALRDGMPTEAPARLDAEVTLMNLAADRTVTLQDSVFRYLDGATAHNYYTTDDIQPSTAYRLVVRGPGAAESGAETTVPDAFPRPTVSMAIPRCFPTCPPPGGPHSC